jgi:rhodanese-related sulfurtransferase
MSNIIEVSPAELDAEIKAGTALFLLDVRESDELEVSVLPNVHHIPLGQIENRYAEVPKDQDVVIICRSGGRSGRATEFLMSRGYDRVRNMATGMNGWATTVDTTLTVY